MSRFYEALRRAEQSSGSSKERAAVASDAAAIPERMNVARSIEEQRPEPSTPPMPAAEELISEVLNQALASTVSSAHEALGVQVQTAVDRRARICLNSADPRLLERYRMIATKILQKRSSMPFRSVLVTSASPQDGKTITVINLGMAFGLMPSFKVLVVDGDLRRGDLSKTLGAGDRPGFGNWLEGTATLEEVVLQSPDLPMKFIVHGNSKVSSPELLQSVHFTKKMKKLAEHFDLVLVDSPPASLLADAQFLASACDGVLLVARAFATTCRVFEDLCQNLQQFPMVGSILNGGAGAGRSYRRYQYGY